MPIGIVKFAEFELDGGRYELRRGDRVLKLEKIPMELLTLLAESNGRLVSRDEIVETIWGKDVFVDTEHGFKQRAAKKYVAPMVFAFANAQLKRKEETLRYLEESYQQRSPELVFVQNDPNCDFVHSDPRYRAIIKTMGLPRAN